MIDLIVNLELYPDIDKLCSEQNEETLKKTKNVKIPGKQLWAYSQRMGELVEQISEDQQIIQDLTEVNLQQLICCNDRPSKRLYGTQPYPRTL